MKDNCELKLCELPVGETAVITKLPENEDFRFSLLRFGMTENTKIIRVYAGPMGEPSAYSFRGTLISIRNADAKEIRVMLLRQERRYS